MKSVLWQPRVVFQNSHLALIWKPPVWLSVPPSRKQNPYPILGLWAQRQLNQRIYPVHRLDQPVSGLWLVALTPAVQQELQKNWWQLEKTYDAWVSHPFPWPASSISLWEDRLQMGKKRAFPHAQGELCQIWVKWLGYVRFQKADSQTYLMPGVTTEIPESTVGMSWVQVRPLQGKRHQIRAQLALRRWPILGDQLYGSPWSWDLTQWDYPNVSLIALHLSQLRFPPEWATRWQLPQDHFRIPPWDGFFRFPATFPKPTPFNFDKWVNP